MNSLQVKYFLGAAECGSLSRAADAFFISQPALSKQIRGMEQELGVTLFRRSSGGVALTDAGRLLYRYFSDMDREFNAILTEARQLSGQDGTSLRIGVPEDWDVSPLTLGIREHFSARFPGVPLNTSCENNLMTLVSRLQEGYFDLLFLPFVPSPHLEGIATVQLTEVPMALIVSGEHPLCRKENLSVEDFRDELFLVPGHDGVDIAKRALFKYLAPYRFLPRVETRENMGSVILGVLGGEGVTLRSAWSMAIENPNFRCIQLAAAQSVYLAYRADDRRGAVRELAELIAEYFAKDK